MSKGKAGIEAESQQLFLKEKLQCYYPLPAKTVKKFSYKGWEIRFPMHSCPLISSDCACRPFLLEMEGPHREGPGSSSKILNGFFSPFQSREPRSLLLVMKTIAL